MNFKNWKTYKDECKELNLYIKSYLKELGLKPKKDATSEIHKVYTGGRWKEFEFFKLEDTEQIRAKNKCVIIITKEIMELFQELKIDKIVCMK